MWPIIKTEQYNKCLQPAREQTKKDLEQWHTKQQT